MAQTGMCLEEYLDYLRGFRWGGEYLYVNLRGDTYRIYYVPAEESGRTGIPVPLLGLAEISGNNMDGFVVTVRTLR